jgi:hypothetical protein
MRLNHKTATLFAVGVLLAGCGNSPETHPSEAQSPSMVAPSPANSPTEGTTVVTAELGELTITLSKPSGYTPGAYTFVVHHTGVSGHALAIKGPGVDTVTPTIPAGGADQRLTVTLQSGEYDVWCPVGSHKAQGMSTRITVS